MISICPSVRLSPYNSALYLGGGKGGTGVPEQFRVNLGRRTPQRTDRLRRYQHHVRMYVTMIYSTLYVLAQSFSASFLVRLWLSGIDRCRTSSFFSRKKETCLRAFYSSPGVIYLPSRNAAVQLLLPLLLLLLLLLLLNSGSSRSSCYVSYPGIFLQ